MVREFGDDLRAGGADGQREGVVTSGFERAFDGFRGVALREAGPGGRQEFVFDRDGAVQLLWDEPEGRSGLLRSIFEPDFAFEEGQRGVVAAQGPRRRGQRAEVAPDATLSKEIERT